MPQYQLHPYTSLPKDLLYGILELRSKIFVVEQNCNYQDVDGNDKICHHLCLMDGEKLIGAARIIPPRIKFPGPAIGRLVLDSAYRGKGLGAALMMRAVEETWKIYDNQPIGIEAQAQLKEFYESLGYEALTEPYMLEGLLHIKMQISKK